MVKGIEENKNYSWEEIQLAICKIESNISTAPDARGAVSIKA